MRTLLLTGIALLAALAADQALAHNGQTSTRTVRVIHAGSAEDAAVYSSDADRAPTEGDYRGRWQGQWNGSWEDAEGRRYNGTYEGEYDAGADGAAEGRRPGPLPAEYRDGGRRISADCDARGESVIGTVAGGAIGGAIGNRVAGRGNRTIGTVVGAGVGAVAGGAIGNAAGRADCERQERAADYRGGGRGYAGGHGGGYRDGHYASSGYSSSGYSGYEGGQVIVIPGQPIIIEETETTYETVVVEPRRTRVAPRPRVVHHRRPIRRAAARCSCR